MLVELLVYPLVVGYLVMLVMKLKGIIMEKLDYNFEVKLVPEIAGISVNMLNVELM